MKTVAFDLEHDGLHPLYCTPWSLTYSINGAEPKVVYNGDGLRLRDIPKEFIKAVTDPSYLVIAHNVKNDCAILLAQFNILCNNLWCTLESERDVTGVAVPMELAIKKTLTKSEEAFMAAYGLSYARVVLRYFGLVAKKGIRDNFIDRPKGLPLLPIERKYMVDDVAPLTKLQRAQEYLLRRDEQLEVALLENRYAYKRIIAKVGGIGIDKNIWRRVANENGKEFKKRGALLPKEVENWNSPAQVKAYFKYNHNIVIPTYRSNTPEIDDLDTLYLKTKNKTLGNFILYRELHKSVTSYGLGWLNEAPDGEGKNRSYIDADGRIRPSINQQLETGRISMSNPNLLQLPGFGRKDYDHDRVMEILYKDLGQERQRPKHRTAFVPRPGYVFVIGDFSGQEIGIMAAASGEKLWINALLRGESVHSLMATMAYEKEWQDNWLKTCTFPFKCSCPGHRNPYERAKVGNFQRAYGGGFTRYAKSTGIDLQRARFEVAKQKRATPRLNAYLDKCARQAVDTGISYSSSPYRRRRVLKAEEKHRIENQGKNNPTQAAGADMIKLACISIPDEFYQPLDIYDEIILEVPKKDGPRTAKMLKSVMEQSADFVTGIKGLIKVEPKIQINLAKDDKTAIVNYSKTKKK